MASVIPPSVNIFYPPDETRFGQPFRFSFQVIASDSDGSVSNVSLFVDGLQLAVISAPPYGVIVSNLAAGSHSLTARATDNQGHTGEAVPVTVLVTAPAGGAAHLVDIGGSMFTPAVLNVTNGDAVIFRNLDPINHTATGGFTSKEAFFGSLQFSGPVAATNTFTAPGTFAYMCGLHPVERGTVIVAQAMSPPLLIVTPRINSAGQFSFDLAGTEPGRSYVVQRAAHFSSGWFSIQTNVASTNGLGFVETNSISSIPFRMFRAVKIP